MQTGSTLCDHQVYVLQSKELRREVTIELFLPPGFDATVSYPLLLVNDGQDMTRLGMRTLLDLLYRQREIRPLIIAAIHAADRLHEYGTASLLDYRSRGSRAHQYNDFIISRLLPDLGRRLGVQGFLSTGFAGFSLGGLSALDMVWHYPHVFQVCGVFSGSLWWRRRQFDPARPDDYRIIHELISSTGHRPHLRFWFQCGTEDEAEDRNNNGIIDSIDDTLDLVAILRDKGYQAPSDLYYHEIEGGRHDVATWAKAMPVFLRWAYPV